MVSVIVPVYNVQPFLERGLQCVLAQTYTDFELILSDDGSTDSSLALCRQWAEQDCRIRVIHQPNRGAGAARNHGLEEAKGDYIYFFDIDDQMSPNLLEYCVKTMEERDVDLICFGYNNVETTYRSSVTVTFPETLIESNEALRQLFVDQFVMKENGFPWNKFYRKSFLDTHGIRYEDQRIQQDEVFNLKCYRHLQRAYLSPEVLYTYYVYEKGNTRSRFIPDRFDIYKSVHGHFEALRAEWPLDDARLIDFLDNYFYDGVLQCIFFNLTHPECPWTRAQKQEELERIMSDELTLRSFDYAESHQTSLEQRLKRGACRRGNLGLVGFYAALFGFLHKTRKRLKRR